MMSAPLLSRGRIIGAITVGDELGRQFTERDVRYTKMFADMAAIALPNAQQYRAEERLRAEAEAANRAKDEFLAMLGHELRNPLAAIGNAAQVLDRSAPLDAAAARASAIIHRQVRHLAGLVDDLLDAARVSTGKIVLRSAAVDLGATVARGVANAPAPHHTVHVDARTVWIRADEVRLEQIIGNLLSNALRYTPPGGTVAVRAWPDGDDAVLEVADTGAGIAPALLPRVFEPFVQGEPTADRTHGGLGLGLALVKRLAEMHGGGVSAASEGPGRGSTFTVRLPRIAPPVVDAGAGPSLAKLRPRCILIVEDNADARDVLALSLTLEGHEVHERPSTVKRGSRRRSGSRRTSCSSTWGFRTRTATRSRVGCAPRRQADGCSSWPSPGMVKRTTAVERWRPASTSISKPVAPEHLLEALRRAPTTTRRS